MKSLRGILLLVPLVTLACSSSAPPAAKPSLHIYLVRHAEAWRNVSHPADMPSAQLDSLTPHGLEQAATAAASLKGKPIAAIVVSPSHRTMQTAGILARELHLAPPASDPAFAPLAEDESLAHGLARALRAIRLLAETHPNQSIIIVTHGDIVPALIGEAHHTPLAQRLTVHDFPPGSITPLDFVAGSLRPCPDAATPDYRSSAPRSR